MREKHAPSFFLPGRLLSRWAGYLSDIQALTVQGTTEPRRWIGCMEEFWLNVTSDHADWLREIGYGDEAPAAEGLQTPQVIGISRDHPVTAVRVEVPASVFERLGADRIAVYPSPLELRGTVVGFPGTNLLMDPPNLTKGATRRTQVRVFDLPKLDSGMELRGVVWAASVSQGRPRVAPLVVATYCLRVN